MRAESYLATAQGGGQTLIDLLLERAASPSKTAAVHKQGGRWEEITWGDVLDRVKKLSAGLVAQGVRPGDRVAIFAGTSVQWVLCDLAISAAGAITVPIYASNTPEECRYILNHSESVLAFVDDDEPDAKQPGRISRLRTRIAECPTVKKVVLFSGEPRGPGEQRLSELVSQGEAAHQAHPEAFDVRVKAIKPDDLECFIYTSGTTGDPKGVMLTHGNWVFETSCVAKLALMKPDDSVMLFLPLAHSFAQVVKVGWLGLGFKVIFAESIDKMVGNLAETHPTILPSVPRVFEKVYNKVYTNAASAPGVKGKLARWAFKLFDEYAEAKSQGREYSSLGWGLAKRLVFSKIAATVNQTLGGNMRLFISGGAPLSKKIAYFFDLLGFKVLEGYGLTETSAASTVNPPTRIRIGTVGQPLPGCEVKIAADGEILIRGPNVMKGYYRNPEATAESIDKEGWLHSGDIGEFDGEGFLRITDRKKDIIVTAGGKNVAPQNLENLLKTYPLVSSAMVYGDKRPYLTVLVCVSEESARKLLADRGVTEPGDYAALAKRTEIRDAVQNILNELNASQPPYNTLKRFHLMDHDFSQETGELTPTLKVKRKFCTQKYQEILNGLYDAPVVE